MAYTKIFAVRNKMARAISYAVNPDKITLEDGTPLEGMLEYALDSGKTATVERLFESAINCATPETAFCEMRATKRRFGKEGGVQGYHVIQSFKPGEVTPEQAHAIGVEFARRCFGEQYEVVVGTHLDKGHLHSHIVVNSVSYIDGKKYHSNRESYYRDIRGISDALCREHGGLSVIDPKGRGKHYKQWYDEKQGKPSSATLIKADIDDAIKASFTFNAFIENMKRMGYGIHLLIDHGNGYKTLYAHMSMANVVVGDSVDQGQVIGLVGSTGTSTNPHLHFEVRVGGSTVDPLQFFR